MARALALLRVSRNRFSLSMMFLFVALIGLGICWPVALVHQRTAMRRWIRDNGGMVQVPTGTDGPVGPDRDGKKVIVKGYEIAGSHYEMSAVRRWLGDEVVTAIEITTDEQIDQIKSRFPEAIVERGMTDLVIELANDLPSIE